MATMHFFLPLLPDEHYYSRIARMAVLTPTKSITDFYSAWLGANRILSPLKDYEAIRHGVAAHTNATASVTNNVAAREDVLYRHTSAGFYRHFLNIEQQRALLDVASKGKRKPFFMPWLTKVRHANCWRSCPQCIEDDISNYGASYWHTAHQLPTAATCHKHRSQTLMAGCSHCGFEQTDLRDIPLPDIVCPECDHNMSENLPLANAANAAIQHVGLALHLNRSSCQQPLTNPQILRLVEYAFGDTVRNRQQAYWETKAQVEQAFWEWVSEYRIDDYFVMKTDEELQTLLCLESIMNTPTKVTPLAHIIWLAFFNHIGQFDHARLSSAS
ncbi:MAG: TniQ family protein [Pseudomonadota bacterium]|nr:TniQ family protein [Pseudomonadota bacterium]